MNFDAARQLVEQHILPAYPHAQAAIIGGSIARGQGTATSDIDLLVLFENVPHAWRETLKLGQQTVELYGHDLRSFDYFCRKMDRPGGRIPMAMMVIEGRNLLPQTSASAALYQLAQAIYDEGPPALTPDALASRRYEITTLLEDLVDSTVAEETLAIATKLYDVLANFVLRAGGAWSGVGKHLARRLRAHNPSIADDLHAAMRAILLDPPAGKQAFGDLVARALQPYGGPLLDGFALHAPAEWKSDTPALAA
ncbi:putative nucleotidyltransferase [Janthinobacterium lividum]|uniref:nucleotidyltransferase domain-containing protein n=1 Tax=Janthinobacterium lividum TaxID=29581 RepID=UPI003D1D6C90